MTAFPEAFKTHVVPRMRAMIRWQAFLVDRGDTSFTAAASAVMHRAHHVGAGRLPDRIRDDLDQWVTETLYRDVGRWEELGWKMLAECEASGPKDWSWLTEADEETKAMNTALSPLFRAVLMRDAGYG